jgi:hypothetical protein
LPRDDYGAAQVSAGNSPDRRTEAGDTEVVIFAVYGDWRAVEPVLRAIVAEISRSFRPGDPSACVWVDSDHPSVLRICSHTEAEDFDAAIRAGRLGSAKRLLARLWAAGRSG